MYCQKSVLILGFTFLTCFVCVCVCVEGVPCKHIFLQQLCQLNLKCKLIPCTFLVILSVNYVLIDT